MENNNIQSEPKNNNYSKTIHGVRSWGSNFYWTSIFLVFKQLGEDRIKN